MKKILKLAALSALSASFIALLACNGNQPAQTSTVVPTSTPTSAPTSNQPAAKVEDIVIDLPSIDDDDSEESNEPVKTEYTGEPISVNIDVPEGCTAVIEYKKKGTDEYTTTPPSDLGEYEIRITVSKEGMEPVIVKQDIEIAIDLVKDYSKYKNTNSYAKVTNVEELLTALYSARTKYTNVLGEITEPAGYIVRNNVRKNETNWTSAITKGLYLKDGDNYNKIPADTPFSDTTYTADMTYYEDSPLSKVSYTQTVTEAATVKVIEIAADLDLGYNRVMEYLNPLKDSDLDKYNLLTGMFENWDKSNRLKGSTDVYADPDLQEAGISKVKVENTTDLLIYSKNGAKLTHCGFNVSSCKDVQFKNLDMDEIWMWEDSTSASPTIKVGDYDSFGWAYFKVSFSDNILIDHCSFGKSFDGQIDYSNPCYSTIGTYQKAPYGATGSNGLKVTYCDFKAGSDDQDGYLYKMMDKIEKEYQVYSANKTGYSYTNKSCRYYFTLRDAGLSFDDVLYGIAIPQKKAFLWGDSGDSYEYNKYLTATLANCTIKNIEDRLPKVRGGMAYVYNVLVDNTEYFEYVNKIKSKQGTVQNANSKYKLGAVSQGLVIGLDASVYLESVEYKGISSYLKNNDSAAPDKQYPTVNGGYMIVNSILGTKHGSTDIENNDDPFTSLNSTTSTLSTEYFAFKENGEKIESLELPIEIKAYEIVKDGEIVGSLEDYFAKVPTGVIVL